MRARFGIGRNGAVSLALVAGIMVAGVGTGAEPAYAQAKKDQLNSPAFIAAAQPLLEKVSAALPLQERASGGDAAAKAQLDAALAGAPAMLAQADAVAKTPRDKLTAGQLAMQIGLLTNDLALAQRGARAMLATKQLDPAQTAQVEQTLQRLSAVPARDTVLEQANTYARANDPRAALAELRKGVAAQSGRAPSAWYERGIQIADASNNATEAVYWATQWIEKYPSNIAWLAAIQMVRKFGSQEPQDKLDAFRFMARSGALNNETRFVAREYYDYANLANLRGFYNEAIKIVDQGTSAGALTASQGGPIRSAASAKVAADRASLVGQESRARAAADGISALAAADLYLSFGEAAKAEEMYQLALQKGKIDKDRALTRLGTAQFDQGNYAGARDSFSKITGPRQPLARLWTILIAQKSGTAAG
ncbi:MAG: hypothetical protein ABW203_00715 [Novosphingobium sp.]